MAYLSTRPDGATNSQVADDLGLRSDFEGANKDYLSWSILGLLVNERRVRYEKQGRSKIYFNV